MAECTPMLRGILVAVMCVLTVALLLCLARAIRGPRFTDRLVALNTICTLVILLVYLRPPIWWMWPFCTAC